MKKLLKKILGQFLQNLLQLTSKEKNYNKH